VACIQERQLPFIQSSGCQSDRQRHKLSFLISASKGHTCSLGYITGAADAPIISTDFVEEFDSPKKGQGVRAIRPIRVGQALFNEPRILSIDANIKYEDWRLSENREQDDFFTQEGLDYSQS
jgi:hypothetical protein